MHTGTWIYFYLDQALIESTNSVSIGAIDQDKFWAPCIIYCSFSNGLRDWVK